MHYRMSLSDLLHVVRRGGFVHGCIIYYNQRTKKAIYESRLRRHVLRRVGMGVQLWLSLHTGEIVRSWSKLGEPSEFPSKVPGLKRVLPELLLYMST